MTLFATSLYTKYIFRWYNFTDEATIESGFNL